jgi:predicted protein tyrosine phosphatase
MGTYILNKKQVIDFKLDPNNYNVLIRITSPKTEFDTLKNEHIYREILSLKFYDLEDDNSGLYLFNENHLNLILSFFNKHRNCRNMVIHCDEGRSRSAGVAAGWFLFNDVRSSIYKLYHDGIHFPNRRVIDFFYRHFGLSTKSIDKWERELFG